MAPAKKDASNSAEHITMLPLRAKDVRSAGCPGSAKSLKLITTWMTSNGFDSVKDLVGAGDLSDYLGKNNNVRHTGCTCYNFA